MRDADTTRVSSYCPPRLAFTSWPTIVSRGVYSVHRPSGPSRHSVPTTDLIATTRVPATISAPSDHPPISADESEEGFRSLIVTARLGDFMCSRISSAFTLPCSPSPRRSPSILLPDHSRQSPDRPELVLPWLPSSATFSPSSSSWTIANTTIEDDNRRRL